MGKGISFDGYACPTCKADLTGLGVGDRCRKCRLVPDTHDVFSQRKAGEIRISRKWIIRAVAACVFLLGAGVLMLPFLAPDPDNPRRVVKLGAYVLAGSVTMLIMGEMGE